MQPLTAQLRSFIAVVQTIVVSVALPALLDAAVVLACKLSGLALRRGYVGRIGWEERGCGKEVTEGGDGSGEGVLKL